MSDDAVVRTGFFRSLVSAPLPPKDQPDPWGASSSYCRRLLTIYEELSATGSLVSPLPEWVTPAAFPLEPETLGHYPRVQAALADCTAYTPGKWLLEQELMRHRPARLEAELTFLAGEAEPPQGQLSWDESMGDVYDSAHKAQLSGLAFSGGGIRSATFCLGILQALAARDMLRQFDYLSSVSGGGYIHQWFASWILSRPASASRLAEVEEQLRPLPDAGSPARWPSQLQWLRRYSSYLTPQRGVFSADTWTMLCIWFRNTFLNQIVLFGFLATCLLVVRLLAEPFYSAAGAHASPLVYERFGIALLVVVCLYQLCGSILMARALYSLRTPAKAGSPPTGALGDAQVLVFVVLPNLLGAYGMALQANPYARQHWFPSFYSVLWAAQIGGLLIALSLSGLWPRGPSGWQRSRSRIAVLSCITAALLAVGSGVTAHWLAGPASGASSHLDQAVASVARYVDQKLGSRTDLVKVHQELNLAAGQAASVEVNYTATSSAQPPRPAVETEDLFGIVAPLLFLGLEFLAIRLQVGVLGETWAELRREWMARLGAWTAIVSLTWFSLGCIARLGPVLCGWLIHGPGWHKVWAAVVVLAVHGATLYAGASGKSDGKPQPGALLGYKPIDLVGMIGAPLCVVSLLILMAALMQGTLKSTEQNWGTVTQTGHTIAHWTGLSGLNHTAAGFSAFDHLRVHWLLHSLAQAYRLGPTLLLATGLVALFVFFAWRVDINEFSIHGFYRNRLARCYLGATNMTRAPDPFTKFDEKNETTHSRAQDGIAVYDLLPTRFGGADGGYDGPFPIFCSTVNLTFGEDLAYQERKGASFAFTPLYSGYHVGWTAESVRKSAETSFNGYVPTRDYAYRRKGILLSSAAAICGAALSPNQGYSSQPALAFLMTLFNVRLSWWIPNPRKPAVWPWAAGKSTPWFGLWYLLFELFGLANDTTRYVCLCDGGKFENMGLYELVRRRCRFIVVCDAESDANYEFEGIGGAISKCRTDFGAEISLDLQPLRRNPVTGNSGAHLVEGTITYPAPPGKSGQGPYTGRVFYIKSAVVGDEPGDILHHKLTHATFPNDSTVNQWFTESQFESYRRLGQISGEQFLAALRPSAPPPPPLPPAPHAGWKQVTDWLKRH